MPDEVTSLRPAAAGPADLPEHPRAAARAAQFVAIEAAILGDQATRREIFAPLRELGPELDMFAVMPPAGLLEHPQDPEHPVPGMGDHRLLGDARRRRGRRAARGRGPRLRLAAGDRASCATSAARSAAARRATARSTSLDGDYSMFAVGIVTGAEAARRSTPR